MTVEFTGKERDGETGLDYFLARYYSGAQGRFTGTDPKGATPRHIEYPQKWNKYAYVQNNPLSSIDPDGLDDYKVFVPDASVKSNWAQSKKIAESNGHSFTLFEGKKATVKAFASALSDPGSRVIYVGHTTHDPLNFVTGIALSDGEAAGDTVVESTAGGANFIAIEPKAGTVCILACDSEFLRSQYPNSSFVGQNSGNDRESSLEAMLPAAQAFVSADAQARPANKPAPRTPPNPIRQANQAFQANRRAQDLDGDKVVKP